MAKRNKVRIKINHPDFKADCIMLEGKAFTYLKRIKKNLDNSISILINTATPKELDDLKFSVSGTMHKEKQLRIGWDFNEQKS